MAGVLQRFERRLEGAVTGLFAWAFKSSVQPVEIASAVQHEMDSNAQILSRSRVLVPNEFTVELSPSDHDRLTPYGGTLSSELNALVNDHVSEQGYTLPGDLSIDLHRDDTLRTGRFHVSSRTNASVTSAPEHDVEQPGAIALEVNGTRHPVPETTVVIGRSSQAGLRIDDPGISREHARMSAETDGQLRVEDLGSTNGVLVDGRRVTSAYIGNGSRIQLGNTEIIVHVSGDGE